MPPLGIPVGIFVFFFPGGLFPTPELLINLKYVFLGTSFWSVKNKMRHFHNFYKRFPEFIERRINDCHVVKTWTINLKTEVPPWWNTSWEHWTESLFIFTLKALNLLIHISVLIIKATLKKYFCPSFPKNKILPSTHHMLNRFKF